MPARANAATSDDRYDHHRTPGSLRPPPGLDPVVVVARLSSRRQKPKKHEGYCVEAGGADAPDPRTRESFGPVPKSSKLIARTGHLPAPERGRSFSAV
jgi:hypothetical protein